MDTGLYGTLCVYMSHAYELETSPARKNKNTWYSDSVGYRLAVLTMDMGRMDEKQQRIKAGRIELN